MEGLLSAGPTRSSLIIIFDSKLKKYDTAMMTNIFWFYL